MTTVNVKSRTYATEKKELRAENKELQHNIELCHNQTKHLKIRINKLQSNFSTSQDADLGDRVMKLEDYARKESPHKSYCRAGW